MTFEPRGVVPALVTPLDADGTLLVDGLRTLLDHVIDAGVHGVFLLGSAGEFYGLTDEQRLQVMETAVEHVGGRVPVYAGAGEITTRAGVRAVRLLGSVAGIDALSVLTPYFLTPTQTELRDHFLAVAAATDLPVLLYSNPGRTNVPISPETVAELAEVHNIVGIKDSSGDLAVTARYLEAAPPGFSVLIGKDTLIHEGLRLGAVGAIASTANVAPRLVAEIYNAFARGDDARAAELQRQLAPLRVAVDSATFPVALKEGLRMVGVDAGLCLAPAREMGRQERAQLAEAVDGATTRFAVEARA